MTQRKPAKRTEAAVLPAKEPTALLADLRGLILQAREGVARAVDSGLTALYWNVGRRIRQDVLKEKRAEYGERIVSALATQLTAEFGRGFSRRNLFNMVRFAEVFPDPRIVQALAAQLGWAHFSLIIYLDDPLQRDFYAEMCRLERWSTRTLEKKIGGMLYERTALSRKPEKLAALELWGRPHDPAKTSGANGRGRFAGQKADRAARRLAGPDPAGRRRCGAGARFAAFTPEMADSRSILYKTEGASDVRRPCFWVTDDKLLWMKRMPSVGWAMYTIREAELYD